MFRYNILNFTKYVILLCNLIKYIYFISILAIFQAQNEQGMTHCLRDSNIVMVIENHLPESTSCDRKGLRGRVGFVSQFY